MKRSFIIKPTFRYNLILNIKYFLLFGAIILLVKNFPHIPGIEYLLVLPIALCIYTTIYWLMVKYEVTAEQITYKRGLFTYKIDYLEIYRIKDFESHQNLMMRIFNIMHFTVNTSDRSHPKLILRGIPVTNLPETIRDLVEKARQNKRVYEID